MFRFPLQPPEKGAFEHLRVEPISLRPPMLPRHRNAGRVNDVGLDTTGPQPTRQPEPVTTSLKGHNQTLDVAAGFRRLITPAVQLPKNVSFIRLQLLQRRAINARRSNCSLLPIP
jgi:hypothetical protein